MEMKNEITYRQSAINAELKTLYIYCQATQLRNYMQEYMWYHFSAIMQYDHKPRPKV